MVESYRKTCGWHARIGFDEMVSHEYLKDDRSVQRTTWSSGVAVVVNFGDTAFRTGTREVPVRDYAVSEAPVNDRDAMKAR